MLGTLRDGVRVEAARAVDPRDIILPASRATVLPAAPPVVTVLAATDRPAVDLLVGTPTAVALLVVVHRVVARVDTARAVISLRTNTALRSRDTKFQATPLEVPTIRCSEVKRLLRTVLFKLNRLPRLKCS